jgi:hypothetical protein
LRLPFSRQGRARPGRLPHRVFSGIALQVLAKCPAALSQTPARLLLFCRFHRVGPDAPNDILNLSSRSRYFDT